MAETEGDELLPAAHHAESLALLVLPSLGVEFMSGKQIEKLPEDCVMMGHGSDPYRLRASPRLYWDSSVAASWPCTDERRQGLIWQYRMEAEG